MYYIFGMISSEEKNIIIQTLSPFNPKKIGVFGSRARDQHGVDSDLDLLVDLENVNLLDIVALEDELSRLLNIRVDLITEASLNKHLRPKIRQDVKFFYSSLKDENVVNEK
jgi:predicted nucleotidyltransferase